MRHGVSVSPDAITAAGLVRRCITAPEVRRVHLFIDANGDHGVVVRKALFTFVHVSETQLRDPQFLADVRSLLDRVRSSATVDPDVDRFLASVA